MTTWDKVDQEIIYVAELIEELAIQIKDQTLSPEIYPNYTDFAGDYQKNVGLIEKMLDILKDNYKVKFK